MRFPKHAPARQALPDRPVSAATLSPRLPSDVSGTRRALELIVNERCNLMVSSRSPDRLAAWGRAIASSLRSRTDLSFEIYMPASAENLVARFNAATAFLSLKAARSDSSPADGPLRVFLVADPEVLLSPEGQLFARLVGDFPATGIRLLVLADAEAQATSQGLRDVFGRRLRHLSLDVVVQEADDSKLPKIAAEGRPFVAGAAASPAADLPRIVGRRLVVADDAYQPELHETRSPARKGRRVFAWATGGISVVLLVTLVLVLVNRDRTPAGIQRTAVQAVSAGSPGTSTTTAGLVQPSVRAPDPMAKGHRP